MNSILSQTQNSLRPLNKSKKNKRTIPININSNPYPCKFMFKNEKSHIANSYMNIGNEIYKKQKKIEKDFKFCVFLIILEFFFLSLIIFEKPDLNKKEEFTDFLSL